MNFERITARDATIATIAYADIFDYPLTRPELRKWMLIEPHTPTHAKEIEGNKGYFYLKGRSSVVRIREDRAAGQNKKWVIARRATQWLSYIPTIQLVGVTGGLAMNNARVEDDIDLFLITAKGTLWISRLLATIMMSLLGLRRTPGQLQVADKVCLNMFIAPTYVQKYGWGLAVPAAERDVFSAHEVLQMQPIFIRGNAYRWFLGANEWVSAYLPVAWKHRTLQNGKKGNILVVIAIWCLRFLEAPSRNFQLWYMARHRTHEVITDTTLRFHPKDARVWIKRKLAARLARYNVPLDKIFYAR